MHAKHEIELKRLRLALSLSGEAVYDWDTASGAMAWSENALDILGLKDGAALERFESYAGRIHRHDRALLDEVHARHFIDRARFECEYRFRRDDGEDVWLLDRGIGEFRDSDRPARIVGAVRCIARDRPGDSQLMRLANYDELTGQYNRTRLREALERALVFSVRQQSPGAFLLVSVDNMTLINYTRGPDIGDRAVLAVSRALDDCLRASDVVGRVGNEQFGIVLNGCTGENVRLIAQKILDAVQRVAYEESEPRLLLTVSIGAVLYPDTVREAYDAMAKAELALDRARRAGRNCFSIYDLSERETSILRTNIETAETVQAALKENRLALDFQPITDAKTGAVVYHECLLRMVQPGGERIVAGRFLPIVEQMGLIRPLDRCALQMVAAELIAHPQIRLAMNISALSTADPAWFRLFTTLFEHHPEIAERLMIEITETAVLDDIQEVARFVQLVRDAGCRVALDDFGAGYTSFRHLQEMAVDFVKIDGSFVRSLAQRSDSRLFVRTLQTFADGMGLKTIAECVESEELANLVAGHGVHHLQGYHLGRPTAVPPWRADGSKVVSLYGARRALPLPVPKTESGL